MPDFEVEMTLINSQRQTITKSVIIPDSERNLANVLGIEECLKWSLEAGSEIPQSAYDYWLECKQTGGQLYEILTNLEANYGLTFNIKDVTTRAEVPAPPTRSPQASKNGTSAPHRQPLDLQGLMLDQMEELKTRNRYIENEIRDLKAEFKANTEYISDIRNAVMALGISQAKRKKNDQRRSVDGVDEGVS